MKKILLLSTLLLWCLPGFAQIGKGGRPVGLGLLKQLALVPRYDMPPVNAAALLAEDSIPDPAMKKPIRFGKAQFLSITPAANNGYWETLPNGNRLWRQRVRSAGAFTLSLGFRNVHLPRGSRLFIYSKDGTTLLGAFTYDQTFIDDILATEQINGDEAVIEYEAPANVATTAPFELYRVSHDYRNINKILKSFGDAGTCQININCPPGANYQDVKKGVAAIISSGSELCTGTLLTTTNNSGVPYFLTANHCYDNNTANWVFRFNWEAPACANPAASPSFQSVSGATLKARSAATDFCLVQLSTTPPANYNVMYAGWDKSGAVPASEVCISHPSIDIKKICNAATAASTATYSGATCWKTGIWSNGCPEPGSSGSALLDQNKRVVGQLYGGPSACGQATANMYDYYGKFSLSWTGGGTSATRLKDWLDPGNTNIDTTNIFNPNLPTLPNDAALASVTEPLASNRCPGPVMPAVTILNNGTATLTSLTLSYRVDAGAVTTYSWTGSLASTASVSVGLPAYLATTPGSHVLTCYTSAPNGQPDGNTSNDTMRVTYNVVNATPQALPIAEGFEGAAFPPAGWTIVNPDNALAWTRANVGATGNASAMKDNYSTNDAGQQDYLVTPALDFSSNTADYKLNFKVAYAQYNTIADSLLVDASADCGNTWTTLYRKGGAGLATAPAIAAYFTPTASQWRRDSLSLNQFRGTPSLQLRFTNYSNYGNNIFLDDVNITSEARPTPVFTIQPAAICAGQSVTTTNTTTGTATYSWSMPGGTPAASTAAAPVVTYSTAGTYTITLTATNAAGSQSAAETVTVHALPVPVIARSGLQLSVTQAYATYQWFRDGLPVAGATAQTYTVTGNGRYTVLVTDANGCSGSSAETAVAGVGVAELPGGDLIRILPNPANQYVNIRQSLPGGGEVAVYIYNAVGQQVAAQGFADRPVLRMDISSLSSGLYLLQVRKENAVVTRRLSVR